MSPRQTTKPFDEDGERGNLCVLGVNVKWYSHPGISAYASPKAKLELPITQLDCSDQTSKGVYIQPQSHRHIHVYCFCFHNNKTRDQAICP